MADGITSHKDASSSNLKLAIGTVRYVSPPIMWGTRDKDKERASNCKSAIQSMSSTQRNKKQSPNPASKSESNDQSLTVVQTCSIFLSPLPSNPEKDAPMTAQTRNNTIAKEHNAIANDCS
eukprot:4276582-Amphidinium_carterae.1